MPATKTLIQAVLPVVWGLTACMPVSHSARNAVPLGADASTYELAEMKDALDTMDGAKGKVMAQAAVSDPMPVQADKPVMLKGLGFAQIAGQPGKTMNEKRLMAIRAARLDAMRDLTEQVHGIRLSSQSTVRDAVLRNDQLTGVVDGTLRGAKTISITPKDRDSYEVVLGLERDTVAYLLRAMTGQ